mgnify:CR=1 FL=1
MHSYVLATYCGNDELLERTAMRAVGGAHKIQGNFGASPVWLHRLVSTTSSSGELCGLPKRTTDPVGQLRGS